MNTFSLKTHLHSSAPSFGMLIALLFQSMQVNADDGGWIPADKRTEAAPDVAAVTNSEYKSQCASCHFAFQPGLLPSRSWDVLMDQLPAHFDEEVMLEADQSQRLRRYLMLNASDRSGYLRSIRFTIATPESITPMRITTSSYFLEEHLEKSPELEGIAGKVGGLINCSACHTRASDGFYNEDEIMLPLGAELTDTSEPPDTAH